MSDEDLRKSADRARRMKEWAEGEDGIFAFFDELKAIYVQTLLETDHRDQAARDQIYFEMRALEALRGRIRARITNGMGSAKILDHAAKKAEKQQRKAPNVV